MSEHSGTTIVLPRRAIADIWEGIRQPRRPQSDLDTRALREIMARGLIEGMVPDFNIEDVLYARGCGTLVPYQKALLAGFKIPLTVMYYRPDARRRDATGHEAIGFADLLYFLIQLERLGFPTEPGELIEPVLVNLRKRKMITQSELGIWWYRRRRDAQGPIELCAAEIADEKGIGVVRVEQHATASNYHIVAYFGADGIAWLSAVAPKWRPRRGESVERASVLGPIPETVA